MEGGEVMAIDPKELFSGGRLVARNKAKYMKAMLLLFSVLDTPGLGTIGVTEESVLLVDWEWIAAIGKLANNDEKAALQIGGLLVHEAFHVLLQHGKRSRMARRNPRISNMGDDMSFNNAILDMGLLLPDGENAGLFPEEWGFPRGLTSDAYYDLLMKAQPPPQKGKGKGQPDPNGDAGEGEGEPSDDDSDGNGGSEQKPGKGQPSSGKGKGAPTPPKKPKTGGGWCGSCAGHSFPNEPKETKGARGKTDVERAVRAVAQAVREEAASPGKGTVPAFLARWAEEMLAPAEVPWEQELAAQTRNAMAWRPNAVDHKYDAPSRRQAGIGYGPGRPMLPRFRMPVPNVTVIVDTSGSMGAKELGAACRETAGILKAVGANVTFVTCDAQVHGITKVQNVKQAIAALAGGGGTDMRPALEAVAKLKPRPEVVVCITDLQIGDVGEQIPGVKMVWLGVGPYQGPDPLWGKTIRVTSNTAKEIKL